MFGRKNSLISSVFASVNPAAMTPGLSIVDAFKAPSVGYQVSFFESKTPPE